MPCQFQTRTAFSSPDLSVRLTSCRGGDFGFAGEELSDGNYLVFVRRGGFLKRSEAGDVFADASTVVFFREGEGFQVAHPVEGGDECCAIRFEEDMARDTSVSALAASVLPRLGARPIGSESYLEQSRLLGAIRSEAVPCDELIERAGLLVSSVLRECCPGSAGVRRSSARRSAHSRNVVIVRDVRALLASSFHQKLSVGDVAAAVGVSPWHLSRVFRDHTGRTIHQVLIDLRVREALRRIEQGERDLLRLSLELGFSHHGHLGRFFKRAFGASPSRLRECLRN